MSIPLDPTFSFDNFVIGSGNRLAAAAARRTAESPGTSYNPLVIHSPSGLGKTHLLNALAWLAREVGPDVSVRYETLENFVDRLSAAIARGAVAEFRAEYTATHVLLLDDVQFLAGKGRTQEELLRIWDDMGRTGSQVVLALDRPPADIDGLDQRLSTRFSSGLIIDILPPDLETRIAILRKKSEERGLDLAAGVAEAVARALFDNVRELQGALNRVAAVQEMEQRLVAADEVRVLLGTAFAEAQAEPDEFGAFLSDITFSVSHMVEAAPWRRQVGEMILRYEGEGIRTHRLEEVLDADSAPDVEQMLSAFAADVERLRAVQRELEQMDARPTDPSLLHDPERLEQAETYLAAAHAAAAPLPVPPDGKTLDDWESSHPSARLTIRAAREAANGADDRYNPLFLFGPASAEATALIAAIGRATIARQPEARVAYVRGAEIARELVQALNTHTTELWRRRYGGVSLLLIDSVEELNADEREQEELFHLLDTALRSGVRMVITSSREPKALQALDARLRSRFEGGLVVDLAAEERPPDADVEAGSAEIETAPARTPTTDRWFFNTEKIPWSWVALDDRLVEDLG